MLYISSVNIGLKDAVKVERLLKKLAAQQTRIGDVCNVSQGNVTGLDRISQKHLKRLPRADLALGQGCFVLTDGELKQLSDGADPIIKAWFKNSDLRRYVTFCSNSECLFHATVDLYLKSTGQFLSIFGRSKRRLVAQLR